HQKSAGRSELGGKKAILGECARNRRAVVAADNCINKFHTGGLLFFVYHYFTTFREKLPLFWRSFFSFSPINSPAATTGTAGGQVIRLSAAIRPEASETGI